MGLRLRLVLLLTLAIAGATRAEEQSHVDWGKELFLTHCASCHGTDATGSGPRAKSMKPRPKDLTLISKRHGGAFPRSDVVSFIEGQRPVEAHQSEMPRWGMILRKRADGSISARGSVPEIYAITDYLGSIQKK